MTVQRIQIATDRFGPLAVALDDIIELPDGMLGLPEFRRAVQIPVDDDGTFCWMQSVDDPALAFLMVAPWRFFPDYELELPTDDAEALGLHRVDEALTWCLITVHREPERFTANLLGPVVVNHVLRRARQVVLPADLPTQAELITA